ncbi:MAG: D-alanine--D-alanine ligase [Clostridia bacterium]|nr:D-alanine--D-alanine ligase [Clostridia bacterium]
MSKKTICVIFGANSNEYEVSLKSAYSVLMALDTEKYIIHKIGITREGKWLLFGGSFDEILSDTWHKNPKNEPLCVDFNKKCLLAPTKALRPDIVLPMLHGEYGEDGRIQSIFELLDIKTVGVSSAGAALCMDKHISKTIAMRELIPVVPYVVARRGKYDPEELRTMIKAEGAVFVKPTRAGSSVGISRVTLPSELDMALAEAFKYSSEVLIEKAIDGRECEVAILENDGKIIVSEVGEISYKAPFYDYKTKYASSTVKYKIPSQIPDICRHLCRKYASELFVALGAKGMARVDFFVTDEGEVYFNEINAIPGFTSSSMYPMLMEREGYSMRALIDALINNA